MSWLFIVLAGLLEVFVVVGIRQFTVKKYKSGVLIYTASLTSSLYFLHLAMKSVDMSVAYAAYTGIGIVGAALCGMLLWGDKKSIQKCLYIIVIIFSVAVLKVAG